MINRICIVYTISSFSLLFFRFSYQYFLICFSFFKCCTMVGCAAFECNEYWTESTFTVTNVKKMSVSLHFVCVRNSSSFFSLFFCGQHRSKRITIEIENTKKLHEFNKAKSINIRVPLFPLVSHTTFSVFLSTLSKNA